MRYNICPWDAPKIDVDTEERWYRLLNWDQVHEMQQHGFEFGSHSCTHRELTSVTRERCWDEIARSRKQLGDRLGTEVHSFCYPRGDLNATVMEMVGEAGYRCAVVTPPRPQIPTGRFALRRVGIYAHNSFPVFRLKITLPFRKHQERLKRFQKLFAPRTRLPSLPKGTEALQKTCNPSCAEAEMELPASDSTEGIPDRRRSVSNRARIWMIIPTFFPVVGGAQIQAQRLSEQFLKKNWVVEILTRRHYRDSSGETSRRHVQATVPVVRLYSRGTSKIGALLFLCSGAWHLFRWGRRDLYHAHDIGASGCLAIVARYLLGGRCVIKLRTGRVAYEQYRASVFNRLQLGTLLRLADRIIVVNSEVQEMLQSLKIPHERIVRIPNAVDTDSFRPPTSEQRLAARAALGFSPEKPVFVYVGRLAERKGVDVLLQGWSLLPNSIKKNATLAIVGDGPHRDRCSCLIEDLSIRTSVIMAGMRPNIRDYYWAADAFVLASETEGLSNAMVEAMACGLPVVVSRVGGATDFIEEGMNGFTFESNNPEDFSTKLGLLMDLRPRWHAMGRSARRKAKSQANIHIAAESLEKVYNELALALDRPEFRLNSSN